MNNVHLQIFIFFILLLCSCAPDHEIRAVYEEKPCPQQIVLNSSVNFKENNCKAPEPVSDESPKFLSKPVSVQKHESEIIPVTVEKSDQLQKDENECHLEKDTIPVKWEVAVFFDFDKSFLTQTAKSKLIDNIWVLKHKPDMNISVRGYTDSRGSHSYNIALAKRRAHSVKAYLIKHGIRNERIIIDPIGKSLPLLQETTEADIAKNRRVEMLLVNDQLTPIPCILLSHELKEKIQINRDIYCSLWKNKLTWSTGLEFTSDLTTLTQKDETKLKDNIRVLKQYPGYLISLRDFSFKKSTQNQNSTPPIQYIFNYLLKNNIDHKRIQLTKPSRYQTSNNRRSNYCVEILLLDPKAHPMSLITTIRRE